MCLLSNPWSISNFFYNVKNPLTNEQILNRLLHSPLVNFITLVRQMHTVFNMLCQPLSPSHLGATFPVWVFFRSSLIVTISKCSSNFTSSWFGSKFYMFPSLQTLSPNLLLFPSPLHASHNVTVSSFSAFIVGYVWTFMVFHNWVNTSVWEIVAYCLT